MTITNGYTTLAEWKLRKSVITTDATDDTAIESIITNASRMIDGITGKWFYAYTDTREFDYTDAYHLPLDAPLLSITTFTNGDGTTIGSSFYNLLPLNLPHKNEVEIKRSSTTLLTYNTNGDTRGVISIAGPWGYVDRTAIDPISSRIIQNTNEACILIALHEYDSRYGQNISGSVQVTSGGVVITDFGAIPTAAYKLISPYIGRL